MVFHQDLALGGWQKLSLAEQLGNIGSEVGRTRKAREMGDIERYQGALTRALELFDLTLGDRRWQTRLREIERAKEVFCDALQDGKEYGSSLADLERYFLNFALLARRDV